MSQKCFEAIRTIGTIEAIFGFHIIVLIVSQGGDMPYTARFGPGEAHYYYSIEPAFSFAFAAIVLLSFSSRVILDLPSCGFGATENRKAFLEN